MNELETKRHIEQVLARFSKGNLRENGIALLNALGCHSEREVILEPNTFDGLADVHKPITQINREKAMVNEWVSVDILFQLTGDDIREMAQGRFVFDGTGRVDNQIIESYLFIVIRLKRSDYSRSKLADVTREINKFFAMPVMILFQHGTFLTLSIINRRLNKREESKDVLEKVTLIKGINYASPLRAHIEILFDLSFDQLQKDTRFHNFVDLHHAWQKALDTSELNKKFYREIANWYFWAVKKVEFPAGAGQDRETRNATSVIRLITRLIFVWFIKEKGLVPEELFDSRRLKELLKFNDSKASTYYKAILQNLFFATLNTEMGKDRRFRGKNKNPNGLDSHHGISTVYRYEDYFNDPTEALRLFENVPFLNGGLFECLDKREEKILIDGFSDDPRNQPVVPDDLFFGKERPVDLNDIYGDTRHSRENVRGLIHIFNSYKFTIEENTPLEEEIALDPELLGKVFENLLAAYNPETGTTARKQTGSFYTPREIVNYMVDEALIAYLEGKLDGSPDLQAKLRHLLAYNQEPHQFNEDEEHRLIAAIDAVNVLDPACGSGAFPMGVLHKLVFILSKLDPGNQHWKQTQIDKAAEIPDPSVRERVIEDIEKSFTENELDYGRKLYLIENCIYGVDIQPIAVQIAKLRFFISLIVDQNADRTSPNLGVRPLPNLETKFVAANTLIGIERPQQMMLHNPQIDVKEKLLAEVRDALFTARTPATKRKYQELDQKLRGEIAALLKTDGWGSAAAAQLAGWDPYDQNTSSGFFDAEWMFGVNAGFDIVLGNPPYVRADSGDEYVAFRKKLEASKRYQTLWEKWDLYIPFIELGYQLLKPNGVTTMIVSDAYCHSKYAQKSQNWFLQNSRVLRLDFLSKIKVFDAGVHNITYLFQKVDGKDNIPLRRAHDQEFNEIRCLPSDKQEKLTYRVFFPEDVDTFNFSKPCLRLEEICYISVGMVVHADEKVAKGAFQLEDLVSSIKDKIHSKPFVEGKDLNRWVLDKPKYLEWGTNRAPSLFRRKTFIELYEQTGKIMLPMVGDVRAAIDMDQLYCNHGIFVGIPWHMLKGVINNSIKKSAKYKHEKSANPDLPSRENLEKNSSNFSLQFLLGVLNSISARGFLKANRRNNIQLYPEDWKALPIPSVSPEEQKPVVDYVNRILEIKNSHPSANVSALEAEIDRLVSQLYGLTEDEIAIVERQTANTNGAIGGGEEQETYEPLVTPYELAETPTESVPALGDYGLYKCRICGQLVTGFMKDDHAQEKHRGVTVEWKKISG
ncbi:MAG: Eco57I restriction-modification methylase domain-containing protein [Bellilinea sp.]|jgi:hypothetical protein